MTFGLDDMGNSKNKFYPGVIVLCMIIPRGKLLAVTGHGH